MLYIKIRETDIKDWYIELYENFPCENNELLLKREGEVIRDIGILNKVVSGRKLKQWYQDNKEKILNYQREYKEINKEQIKEKNKYTELKQKILLKRNTRKTKNKYYNRKRNIINNKKNS